MALDATEDRATSPGGSPELAARLGRIAWPRLSLDNLGQRRVWTAGVKAGIRPVSGSTMSAVRRPVGLRSVGSNCAS